MFKLRKHALVYDTILKDWGVIVTPVRRDHQEVRIRYQHHGWTTLQRYDPKRFEVWG